MSGQANLRDYSEARDDHERMQACLEGMRSHPGQLKGPPKELIGAALRPFPFNPPNSALEDLIQYEHMERVNARLQAYCEAMRANSEPRHQRFITRLVWALCVLTVIACAWVVYG